jgi:hypothetical protein
LPIFGSFSNLLSGKGDSIVGSFKSIVAYIQDFFEPIIVAVKDAFIAVGKTLQDKREDFADILDTLKEVWAWIDKYLVPLFKTVLVTVIEDAVKKIQIAINVLVPVIKFVIDTCKDAINGFIDIINIAIRAYNVFARLTGKQEVDLIGKIGEITPAGTNLGNRPLGVTFRDDSLKRSGVGAASGTSTTTTTDTSTQNAADTTKTVTDWGEAVIDATDAFSDALKGYDSLLKNLEGLSFDAAQRIRLGLPPLLGTVPENFDVSRIRRADEMGNTFNVTVNGALDSESVSRQIIDILNDSQARGTLGAGAFSGAIL